MGAAGPRPAGRVPVGRAAGNLGAGLTGAAPPPKGDGGGAGGETLPAVMPPSSQAAARGCERREGTGGGRGGEERFGRPRLFPFRPAQPVPLRGTRALPPPPAPPLLVRFPPSLRPRAP